MPPPTRQVELWCDSFHEGTWACEEIVSLLPSATCSVSYHLGFLPVYRFDTPEFSLVIQVFGDYASWEFIPDSIKELLTWGKPDLVAYDREANRILFAVEETAAVPTGNQALQRCERMYGSSRSRIPFWYLLSEYGVHIDGGTRRASIWPTMMGLKLTQHYRTPCLVLSYSSESSPEDYGAGDGTLSLFQALTAILRNFAKGCSLLQDLGPLLATQYQAMLTFVGSQGENLTGFIPQREKLTDSSTASILASIATGETTPASGGFLEWPITSGLPPKFLEEQSPSDLIKPDILLPAVEALKTKKVCYTLSTNAGSRPQPPKELAEWIKQQEGHFKRGSLLAVPAAFSMKLADFPPSIGGGRHVTTAKNILYLIDKWKYLRKVIEVAYPRLERRLPSWGEEEPCLLYVSNSVKPGRIFGDPFTGQIAAFASIFGKFDLRSRRTIAYFPHQAHGQVQLNRERANKGFLIISELVDLLIFHAGVVLDVKEKSWI